MSSQIDLLIEKFTKPKKSKPKKSSGNNIVIWVRKKGGDKWKKTERTFMKKFRAEDEARKLSKKHAEYEFGIGSKLHPPKNVVS